MQASQRPIARLATQRYLSVAAWPVINASKSHSRKAYKVLPLQGDLLIWKIKGRNTSGQCGVGIPEVNPVYEEPVPVSQLEGVTVAGLGIGRNHSAAVVKTLYGGEVWSWGCGQAGKLGHGNSDNLPRPARIEALVGEADIREIALGHQHTLFLDSEGAVWSCGENKEGQCGFGTPLQAIADQHRAEWEMGRAPWVNGNASDSGGGRAHQGSAAAGAQPSLWTTPQQAARMAWSQHTPPFSMQTEFQRQVEEAQRLLAASGQGNPEAALAQAGTGLGLGNQGQGVFAGQSSTPTRIGRDLHGLVSETSTSSGVEDEVVSSLAASRFFSALCTQQGGVWTFGGGFNGELGHQSSWTTEARSVEGAVLQAVEARGGAVMVKAGGTFCMCLTKSGGVLLWGSLPGDPQARRMGGSRLLEMAGLPPMTHIAAGHSHALMSDGRRVWSMGRWLGVDGRMKQGGSWGEAEKVLDLGDASVSSLAAGAQSSAMVSSDGQLYLWGKLLSQDEVTRMRQQSNIFTPDRSSSTSGWPGLGSDKPQPVPGLGQVKMVQLGFQHALAVVE